jgi:uncharacterized protein
MADPWEGVAADGTIVTGADRSRVPAAFEPVLADAAAFATECGASLYVYGSVANGTVRPGFSDVDLLSVGLPDPPGVGQVLSDRYAGLCRGVEISAATAADLAGNSDAAYGNRVFLRHYCVHLAGPDPSAAFPGFPADARAARGFNGDIAWHHRRWRQALESGTAPEDRLGARVARKTLLAVAGLVSVHDRTWTTDRARAARRWGEIEPGLAAPLGMLLSWATAERSPAPGEVRLALAGDAIIAAVVDRFASLIGLWRGDPPIQLRARRSSDMLAGVPSDTPEKLLRELCWVVLPSGQAPGPALARAGLLFRLVLGVAARTRVPSSRDLDVPGGLRVAPLVFRAPPRCAASATGSSPPRPAAAKDLPCRRLPPATVRCCARPVPPLSSSQPRWAASGSP